MPTVKIEPGMHPIYKLIEQLNVDDRPDIPALYGKLSELTSKPVDLSPLKEIAAAAQEGGRRDFLGGLALSTLGGSRMSALGKSLGEQGITDARPLRPNAADVGYTNPETGEMVVNPIMKHGQDVKSVEHQIKMAEQSEGKRMQVAQQLVSTLEASGRAQEANAMKMLIAQMAQESSLLRAQIAAAARGDKPGKDSMPSAMQKAYVENNANINFIDEALAEGSKYKNAFGLRTFLPEEALARLDAKGISPRSLVQNISSLKIHDRSGAAVTAAEFPRLKQFVPIRGDTWDAVETKLKNFKRELDTINKAIAAGWPTSALVANLDKKKGATPPVAPAADEGWTEINGVRVREKR